MKDNQKGFAIIESLLVVIILAMIAGVGYYVWHTNQQAKATLDAASKSAASSPAKIVKKAPASTTTNVNLKYSKLSFTYDSSLWKLENNNSEINQYCGQMDTATLAYKVNEVLTISFELGSCGKGGGDCAMNDCQAEVKEISKVALSNTDSKYILANRTSNDKGKTWDYEVWLSDTPSCADYLCGVGIKNLTSNPGLISARYNGAGDLPGNPKTLNDFVNLKPIKDVITVLQTLHY